MSEITSKFLTKGERKLLNAMLDVDTVKLASGRAWITIHTAYNILYRMREKYTKSRGYVNVVDAQKRRGKLFRKVLA